MFDKPYPDGGKLGGGGIGEYELQQELPQSALLLLPLFAREKTVFPSALACTVKKELFYFSVQLSSALLKKRFPPAYKL